MRHSGIGAATVTATGAEAMGPSYVDHTERRDRRALKHGDAALSGLDQQRLDVLPQLADRGVTDAGIGAERAGDLAVERGGEVGPIAELARDGGGHAREGGALAGEHARDDAQQGLAGVLREGLGAAERLVQHRGEREDVGLRGDPVVAHLVLLGGRVAEARAGDRDRLVDREIRQLHEAKVRHLGDLLPVLLREQDVRGLEIAVDDALLVHRVQRAGDLLHHPADARDRQPEAALRLDHLGERLPVDVLEDDEREIDRPVRRVGRPDAVIVEADDVGVGRGDAAEAAEHVGLALEALHGLAVYALGPEDLDNDEEPVGIVEIGAVNPALAALAEEVAEVVALAARALDHGADQGVAQLGSRVHEGESTRDGAGLNAPRRRGATG
jgi:hypothetical protein